MVEKRKPENQQLVTASKRQLETFSNNKQIFKSIKRTSLLSQPIMQLSGHSAPLTTCQFANIGGKNIIAASGHDGKIILWNAWGNADSFATIGSGGKKESPILQLQWSRDARYLGFN